MHHRSNPVLDADWPDPDAVRVGGEFWMITSSLNRAPGLPVLRSRNLVDWEHVTNALPVVPPHEHFATVRRGSGVWAPSIREHDGEFFIVYPDPDHGIFVLSAPHPSGPWSEPRVLLPGRGLIDPCPLWDEDGRAYLVHGWARSRAGVKDILSLVEVTPDLRTALTPGRVVIEGSVLEDGGTLEGPKFYRHGGWYWILAPAGGVESGYQVAFRSRHVDGPYEHRVVLEQDTSPVNGPHQGALVDDSHGNWWFVHFQDRRVFGRVTHVQPVTWGEDGWPHLGERIDAVRGRPVAMVPELESSEESRAAEGGAAAQYAEPARSDSFTSTELLPRWHWQANPRPTWAQLRGSGHLDLAFGPSPRGDLRDLGQVLGQQVPGKPSTWTTTVSVPSRPGSGTTGTGTSSAWPPPVEDRAGMVVLGLGYAWAGLRSTATGWELAAATMAEDAFDETVVHAQELPASADGARVELTASIDEDAQVTFTARVPHRDPEHPAPGSEVPDETADAEQTDLLSQWAASKGRWIGAEVGLFAATSALGTPDVAERAARFGPVVVRREGREV